MAAWFGSNHLRYFFFSSRRRRRIEGDSWLLACDSVVYLTTLWHIVCYNACLIFRRLCACLFRAFVSPPCLRKSFGLHLLPREPRKGEKERARKCEWESLPMRSLDIPTDGHAILEIADAESAFDTGASMCSDDIIEIMYHTTTWTRAQTALRVRGEKKFMYWHINVNLLSALMAF